MPFKFINNNDFAHTQTSEEVQCVQETLEGSHRKLVKLVKQKNDPPKKSRTPPPPKKPYTISPPLAAMCL